MKRFFKSVFVMFIFGVCACTAESIQKLKFKDVHNFSVIESRDNGVSTLHISGLAFHSALAVERMETKRKGNDLLVYLILAPARKGLSGQFDYTIKLPTGVKRVLFGEGENQIWPVSSPSVDSD